MWVNVSWSRADNPWQQKVWVEYTPRVPGECLEKWGMDANVAQLHTGVGHRSRVHWVNNLKFKFRPTGQSRD